MPTALPDTPCDCFIPGESTAAWLTASCAGDISAVQARWRSQLGGSPAQLEHVISVLARGAFPAPGSPLQNQGALPAVVSGLVLTDGAVNEFRFLDPPTNAVPLSVPVANGQSFVVSLKFVNQSDGAAPFAPDIVYDGDGCQPGLSSVDMIPGGWVDACPLVVTGDWALRDVIDCAPPAVPTISGGGAVRLVALVLAAGLTVLAQRRRTAS